jgi:hypothetical protein
MKIIIILTSVFASGILMGIATNFAFAASFTNRNQSNAFIFYQRTGS